ncbi:hypothetical protein DH86_00003285 [Scytalidium sp. 3C]|nr:hypothetical protein DH86_00003285 [Scytalidium sp. 3C]
MAVERERERERERAVLMMLRALSDDTSLWLALCPRRSGPSTATALRHFSVLPSVFIGEKQHPAGGPHYAIGVLDRVIRPVVIGEAGTARADLSPLACLSSVDLLCASRHLSRCLHENFSPVPRCLLQQPESLHVLTLFHALTQHLATINSVDHAQASSGTAYLGPQCPEPARRRAGGTRTPTPARPEKGGTSFRAEKHSHKNVRR